MSNGHHPGFEDGEGEREDSKKLKEKENKAEEPRPLSVVSADQGYHGDTDSTEGN